MCVGRSKNVETRSISCLTLGYYKIKSNIKLMGKLEENLFVTQNKEIFAAQTEYLLKKGLISVLRQSTPMEIIPSLLSPSLFFLKGEREIRYNHCIFYGEK